MKSNKQIFRGKKILGMCFVISFCIRVNKGENKLHANTQIISLKMFNSRTRGQVWNDSSTTARGRGCRQGGGWGGSRKGGGVGSVCQVMLLCLRLRFVNGSAINSSKSSVNPFYDLCESRRSAGGQAGGVGQKSPVRRSKEKNSLNIARRHFCLAFTSALNPSPWI